MKGMGWESLSRMTFVGKGGLCIKKYGGVDMLEWGIF